MNCAVQPLTPEAFAPYGSYFDLKEGYGEGPVAFQPDRMLQQLSVAMGSVCSIRMEYRELQLTETEYHDHCEEVFGGFDRDTVFHVCLLDREEKPDLDSLRVFRLPAGGFVRVKRRVLHHAAFVLNPGEMTHGVVLLSPSAFTIDCKVLRFDNPIPITL